MNRPIPASGTFPYPSRSIAELDAEALQRRLKRRIIVANSLARRIAREEAAMLEAAE